MSKAKSPDSSSSPRKIRPAISPEARDNQLIALAYNLVEKRLLEGTASSQETTHFLKLGSARERQELKALYADAMAAMSDYQGRRSDGNE